MAGELCYFDVSGLTLYALLFQPGAPPKVRNVVAASWDAVDAGDLDEYDIPLTESPATTGQYLADWPAGVGAGAYTVQIREQLGVAPDWGDEIVAEAEARFDGTSLLPAARAGDTMQLDLGQTNTSTNDGTTVGGQLRRTHALAGGTVANKDYSANPPTIAHRDEADSADLITRTLTVDEDVETDTPT